MELTDTGHHEKVAGTTRSFGDVSDGLWRVMAGAGTRSRTRKDREKKLTQELAKAKSELVKMVSSGGVEGKGKGKDCNIKGQGE